MPVIKIIRGVKFGDLTPEKALGELLKLFNLTGKGVEESAKEALLGDLRALNRGEYTVGEAEHEIRCVVRSIRKDLEESKHKKSPL